MPEPPDDKTTTDQATPPTPYWTVVQVPEQITPPQKKPPHTTESIAAMIVIIVAVFAVLAATFFYMSIDCCESPPRSLGIHMSASSDHTNWELTLSSVPTGIPLSSVKMTIFNASGVVIPPMDSVPFSSLTPENWQTYKVRYDQFVARNTMQVGDRMYLNMTAYPSGCKIQIFEAGGILWMGTLA